MERFDVLIESKKGKSSYSGLSFDKMMHVLNKAYMKYDRKTLDTNTVFGVLSHTVDHGTIWFAGGGSKLVVKISKT